MIYIIWLKLREGWDNPFKDIERPDSDAVAYILGAGPSFKKFLDEYDGCKAKYMSGAYFASNFFVHDAHFAIIKPRYYCLSDGIFFCDSIYKERGLAVMSALAEKVTWPMILFVPRHYLNSDFLKALKINDNIEVKYMHSINYQGLERFRNWSYNKGWGNGEFGSVVLYALYAALVIGYKRINMYGIDHTYFDNLAVDDDNRLCFKDSHYYGTDKNLKPLYMVRDNIKKEDLRTFTVCEYLQNKLKLFTGHEIMERYAQSIGADIINCTPGSMVDAYRRLKNS